MDLHDLELLLTGAHSGLSLLLLALALRQPHRGLRVAAVGVVLSGACLAWAPRLSESFVAWRPLLVAVAASSVYWFWALCRLLFEERFQLQWRQVWMALLPAAAVLAAVAWRWPWLRLLPVALSVGLGVHLLLRLWRDRPNDLLEPRRTARLLFVLLGLLLLPLAVAWLRHGGGIAPGDAALAVSQAAALLLVKLLLGACLFDFRFLPLPPPARAAQIEAVPVDTDAAPLAALWALMEHEAAYRESGLGIGALATRLGLPEYRLRRLINQRLGYRNFNDFLNEWRLREAARRLRDPAEARLPILSIALDVGFGSIGPFNRAFRQRYEMTPSEFRRLRSDAHSGD